MRIGSSSNVSAYLIQQNATNRKSGEIELARMQKQKESQTSVVETNLKLHQEQQEKIVSLKEVNLELTSKRINTYA